MIGEVVVVGDLKLRKGAALDEYGRLGERMYDIVSHLPGFLSVKSFKAEDGEEITSSALLPKKPWKRGGRTPSMSRP
jgi:hypothetical protein